MFDIGFLEILLVFVMGLVVIGPERLPGTIKTCAIWFSRLKRSVHEARAEFEQQIGADEIRREIHNERIMDSMRKFEEQRNALEAKVTDFKSDVEAIAKSEDQQADTTRIAPPSESDSSAHANPNHDTNCELSISETPSEPEPHEPMINDEYGEDTSDLPGRRETRTPNKPEEENGKQ